MNNEFEFPYVHIEHVGQHLANSWSTMFNKIGPSFNNMSNVGDIYGAGATLPPTYDYVLRRLLICLGIIINNQLELEVEL